MNRAGAGHLVIAGILVGLLIAERIRPLRSWTEPGYRRVVRNFSLGAIWTALLTAIQAPLLVTVSAWAVEREIGLLHAVTLPTILETAVAVVLLDYTLWFWHWANCESVCLPIKIRATSR